MRRRRLLLSIIAVLLIAANGVFFSWRGHYAGSLGTITWLGSDSLFLDMPASQSGVRLEQGQWKNGRKTLADAAIPVVTMGGAQRSVTFIELAPNPTYAHFIEAVRDLKARGICNIAVREGGRPWRSAIPLSDGSFDGLDVQALVLCGTQLGDAGFAGTLPPDRPIRLPPKGAVQAISPPAR